MWISQRIISAEKPQPAAETAQITGNGSAQGTNSYHGVPVAASWGIACEPPVSAQAVLIQTQSGTACIGVIGEKKGLQPGELLLYSSGGAEIYLKNSGEVVINGQVFAAKRGN